MKRIIENPILGPEWVPLAEVLRHLMKENFPEGQIYMLLYGEQYIRDEINREGPVARLRKTEDGAYLLSLSANFEVNPPLNAYQFQQMEFLGFEVPLTAKGQYAIDPKKQAGKKTWGFQRLLNRSTSMVKIIDITLSALVVVYGADSFSQFYFGNNMSTTKFVHKLNKMDRYKATETNPKAEIFGFKGMHNLPLFGSRTKSNRKL